MKKPPNHFLCANPSCRWGVTKLRSNLHRPYNIHEFTDPHTLVAKFEGKSGTSLTYACQVKKGVFVQSEWACSRECAIAVLQKATCDPS